MRLKIVTTLTWTLINSHYNIPRSFYHFKRRERLWEPALLIGVVALMVFTLGPLYGTLLETSYDQYAAAGMKGLFLASPFVLANILGLIFGMFLMVGTFFFADDMRVLVSLPLKSSEVLLSKFFVVLLDLMFISLIVVLPAYVYYGVRADTGFAYWPYMLVIFLLSQILPLMVSAIIILPLSRVFRFNKHRDFLIYFLGAIVTVAALVFVYFANRIDPNLTQEELVRLFSSQDALINRLARAYPPTLLVVRALTSSALEGLAWLIVFLALHAAGLGAFIFFANKFYYSVYSGLQENYAKRSALREGEMATLIGVHRSVFSALYRREWWYFLKVPSFAFNGFGNVIIFPVLLVIWAFAGQTAQLGQFIETLNEYRGSLLPAGVLVATLAGGINGLSASIFSREGALINELKALPVEVSTVIKAKFLHVQTLSLIGPLAAAAALGVIFKFTLVEGISIFLVGGLAVSFLNLIQMIIDTVRPSLYWDNPQKAMKQNVNMLFSILIVFGFVAGFGYLTYLLRNTMPGWTITLAIALICIGGIAVSWPVLIRKTRVLLSRDLAL